MSDISVLPHLQLLNSLFYDYKPKTQFTQSNTLMCIFNVYILPKPIMKLYQVIAPFLKRISVLMSFF